MVSNDKSFYSNYKSGLTFFVILIQIIHFWNIFFKDIINFFENNVHNTFGDIKELKANLNGKYIGLYFSSNWSHACKTFTPILVKFYKKHSKIKKFEIIFISSDETIDEFKISCAQMPWLFLSFDQRSIKVKIYFGSWVNFLLIFKQKF